MGQLRNLAFSKNQRRRYCVAADWTHRKFSLNVALGFRSLPRCEWRLLHGPRAQLHGSCLDRAVYCIYRSIGLVIGPSAIIIYLLEFATLTPSLLAWLVVRSSPIDLFDCPPIFFFANEILLALCFCGLFHDFAAAVRNLYNVQFWSSYIDTFPFTL
jgi:hypothetical protein